MLFYIGVYFVAFILAWGADKYYKNGHKKIFILLSVLAVLIPSIIAGVRASGVGTDTEVYVNWVFRGATQSNSFSEMLDKFSKSKIEPLYCFINFILSRVTSNLTYIYFFIEVIILSLIYIGCFFICRDREYSFSFSYLIFIILFYNKTFNLCRQSIAMAFCFYNFKYIKEKSFYKYLIINMIAILFHNSAIVFFPMYFVYELASYPGKKGKIKRTIVILFIIVVALLLPTILRVLTYFNLLGERYSNALLKYGNVSNITKVEILGQLVVLFSVLVFKPKTEDKDGNFFFYSVILGMALFLFGINIKYSQRISYYFAYYFCVYIPCAISYFRGKRDKVFAATSIIIVCLTYAYGYYELFRFDETIPYVYGEYSKKELR